jgi:hypothetical protein
LSTCFMLVARLQPRDDEPEYYQVSISFPFLYVLNECMGWDFR